MILLVPVTPIYWPSLFNYQWNWDDLLSASNKCFNPLGRPLSTITSAHMLWIIIYNYDRKQFVCVLVYFFFYVVPDILHVILESPPSVVFSVPWKVMYYISSGWMHKLICSPETYEKRKYTASRNALMHLCTYIYINLHGYKSTCNFINSVSV